MLPGHRATPLLLRRFFLAPDWTKIHGVVSFNMPVKETSHFLTALLACSVPNGKQRVSNPAADGRFDSRKALRESHKLRHFPFTVVLFITALRSKYCISDCRRNEAPNGGAISNSATISFVSDAKLVMEDNISVETVSPTCHGILHNTWYVELKGVLT